MPTNETTHRWHEVDADTAVELVRVIRSENGKVTWTPVTDGHGIGFRLDHEDGRVKFHYLYPSTDDGTTGGDPGTTFVYDETDGTELRGAVCYLDAFPSN